MTETGDQIPIPRLLSRSPSMWLSGIAGIVGVVGVVVWGLLTQTGTNRVMAALLAVLVPVLLVAVVWNRTWVDTRDGTVSRNIAGVLTRTVPWGEGSLVDLERNRAGQLHLRVKGDAGTIRVTVVAVDLGGDRTMAPPQLRLLADEVARWAPDRTRVAEALRAQADHVAAGGGVRESPLAQRL